MIAVPTFPTILKFPRGGARQLLDRVKRAGGQMNHLGGGASMEPLAAQVVAGIQTVIQDNLTDTDAVALTSHTIAPTNTPATSWSSVFTPVPVIAGNAIKAGAGANSSAQVNAGISDFTLTVNFTFATGEGFNGVIVRSTDSSNYYRFYFDPSGGGLWTLQRRQAGSNTVLQTAVQTLTNGVTYALKVVCLGQTITCYVDNVQKAQGTSQTFNQTITRCGVHMSNAGGTASRMDTFIVTNP